MSFGRPFSFAPIMFRGMFLALLVLPLTAIIGFAAEPKSTVKPEKLVAEPAPLKALLKVEDWQQTPIAAVTSDEIDRLLADELKSLASSDAKAAQVQPAARTTDEEF